MHSQKLSLDSRLRIVYVPRVVRQFSMGDGLPWHRASDWLEAELIWSIDLANKIEINTRIKRLQVPTRTQRKSHV